MCFLIVCFNITAVAENETCIEEAPPTVSEKSDHVAPNNKHPDLIAEENITINDDTTAQNKGNTLYENFLGRFAHELDFLFKKNPEACMSMLRVMKQSNTQTTPQTSQIIVNVEKCLNVKTGSGSGEETKEKRNDNKRKPKINTTQSNSQKLDKKKTVKSTRNDIKKQTACDDQNSHSTPDNKRTGKIYFLTLTF